MESVEKCFPTFVTTQCQDKERRGETPAVCANGSGSDTGRAGFWSVWSQTPDTSVTPVLLLRLSSVSVGKGLHSLELSHTSRTKNRQC
jgi:hypothetical protein